VTRSAPQQPRWPRSPAAARELQEALRDRVERRDRLGRVRRVAGVDASYDRASGTTRAAAVLLGVPDLEPQAQASVVRRTRFPYVPGLLSFREVPALLPALARLPRAPDLVLCDGQGLAHPRRFGLASHLGVLLDLPTIGVAKSRLVGAHGPVPEEPGAWVPLEDAGETIGAVLRTKARAKPLYVSIGHRVSLATAVAWVLRCTRGHRLPEPTRLADRLASRRDRGG
jgi:deoxyribonuclease V